MQNNKPKCAHTKVILKPVGVGGGAVRDTWQCELCGTYFVPKEETMTEKFQITEEQARQLHEDCILDLGVTSKKIFINGMKRNGYIRKSELEQIVDEAEEMGEIWINDCNHASHSSTVIPILLHAVQALKKDHPEFGGKNNHE